MLFREAIAVYSDNYMKQTNISCDQNAELLILKAGGTYNYHCTLKD
jgi:hypothetical protein